MSLKSKNYQTYKIHTKNGETTVRKSVSKCLRVMKTKLINIIS